MSPVKIYVGNIPSAARSSELKELFEKFGKVVECDILKDFGFVHMDDTNDAKAAIAGLNDTLWKGARIRVEISTTKTNKGEPSQRRKMRAPYDSRGPSSRYPPPRGSSSSRGPPMPPPHHRDGPYPPPHLPPHRSSRDSSSRGGGPIRDSRYGGSSSNGRYMSDRGRPYPDSYDHRGSSRGLPPSPLPPPRDYPPYRGGSSSDMRDYRNGMGNGPMSDPYRGHIPPPPPDMYYRGGPPPPQMPPSRYDYDHYRAPAPPAGSSSSSRGSRYRPSEEDRYRSSGRYRSRSRTRSRSRSLSYHRRSPSPVSRHHDDFYRSSKASREYPSSRDYNSSSSYPRRDANGDRVETGASGGGCSSESRSRPPIVSSSTSNGKRENNSSYTSSSSTSSLSSAGSEKSSNRSRHY